MHIEPAHIDTMDVLQLDDLRHRLRLSARRLCLRSGIHPSTYLRWMRHARGKQAGSCPHPSTLAAVRNVLRAEVSQRQTSDQSFRPAA